MNVHGIRVTMQADEDTGLPLGDDAKVRGAIRFWRWVDNSRKGTPSTHRLEFTVPLFVVPARRAESALKLPFAPIGPRVEPSATPGVLQCGPMDVWTAPSCVKSIDFVTGLIPERIASIKPRPSDWSPQ